MSLSDTGDPPVGDEPPVLFPAPTDRVGPADRRSATTPPADRRSATTPPADRRSATTPPAARRPATTPPADAEAAARQLTFFAAEAADPSVADLAGLLAGPAEAVRMGGTARLSVVVDAAWRVHVLVVELAQRGVAATWQATADGRHAVRTSYARTLEPLAAAWSRGPDKRPPAGFHLNGRRLRLWLASAGAAEASGFLLRLGVADEACGEPVGRALDAIGLSGALLGPGEGGPAYLITGRRRLVRLAELVGDPPTAAPASAWPPRT
ncbi:hypothetical protein [Micromonospora sp. KLBMP9576]|uniref:hypothetical protein n=1 Tax=Micromonospora sp. KLBMP9576 TaxID=3424769 RepID=UPI003D916C03